MGDEVTWMGFSLAWMATLGDDVTVFRFLVIDPWVTTSLGWDIVWPGWPPGAIMLLFNGLDMDILLGGLALTDAYTDGVLG